MRVSAISRATTEGWPMPSVAERFWTRLTAHSGTALSDGERRLDYAELLDEIDARVERLRAWDVRRVALALDNGLEWALWDLALLRAGLVCVPLPGFFSDDQQIHVLQDAGVDALL